MAAVQQAAVAAPVVQRRPHRDLTWWFYAIGKAIVGIVFVAAALFPLAWMVIAGFKSKTDTVVFALKEVVRRARVEDLKALIRRVDFEFDPTRLRQLDRKRR